MTINTPDGPAPNRQIIPYDDYLRLMGLLQLGADYVKNLRAVERSAKLLLGLDEENDDVPDAIWSGLDAEDLLRRIRVVVEGSSS